ncbi:sugar kinase [Streptomyces sp. CC53]|uniref:carbohydrate kinase family protein n=1 Tax=unclassified Streptomyces TaxID=2593676 RepID=UPI0008DD3D78|nr:MULTISPECIES: PfkB family carbohydrate kinase [unclassified Streptomyces]OII62417.1 sugar kinase [Streptomyces sp. CC53]
MSGLLVVGDVVTDVVALHGEPLAPGTDTAARIGIRPGGAGANAACWAACSGCGDVRLLGRVGADRASWHEAELRRAGVRPLLVRDAEVPTGTVVSLVDATAGAERTFLTDSGAVLRLSPADWSPAFLDGVARLHLSGYLFFGEPGRGAAAAALVAARERGIPVSVDPASAGFLRKLGTDRFLGAVAGASVLLPNADEARLLTGAADAGAAAAALSRAFPLAVVTLGRGGALLAVSGAVLARVPAPQVTAVDTTGAGDAFTGGFLAALLSGASPVEAAAAGCRTAARAVTLVGARPV